MDIAGLSLTISWYGVHEGLLHNSEPNLLLQVHEHVMSLTLDLVLPHPQLLILVTGGQRSRNYTHHHHS